MKTRFNLFLALATLLFVSSCAKESIEEIIPTRVELSYQQNVELAKNYARTQNYMNNFLTTAFAGVVAEPQFYGFTMQGTEIPCPSTNLSADGEKLALNFGGGVNETCEMLNYNNVGGKVVLNKNFTDNITETRECQPGKLEFEAVNVEGCLISANQTDDADLRHPSFYAVEGCTGLVNTNSQNETMHFWLKSKTNWEMNLLNPDGNETVFQPIESLFGSFMKISTPNLFINQAEFQDVYLAGFHLDILKTEDKHNFITIKNGSDKGEDIQYSIVTEESLVYKPYTCNFIVAGTLILGDNYGKPLIGIDFSEGENGNNNGECDSVVKICPANTDATLNRESSECIVFDFMAL